MSSTETKQLSILEWCDKMHAEGKELVLNWEGGNDSGWVYFTIDEEQLENAYTGKLVEYMYDTLDYGSWAGEFTANGSAVYDPEEKAFVGIDNYGEDATYPHECNIIFKVPKSLWFDRLELQIENEGVVSAAFTIKNGFLTPQHDEVIQSLEHELHDKVDQETIAFVNNTQHELRSIWEQYTFTVQNDEGSDPDNYVFKIEEIPMGYTDYDEKDICLSVEGFTEPINENENED